MVNENQSTQPGSFNPNSALANQQVNQLDPVAQRLAAAGSESIESMLAWIENKYCRKLMSRRAFWCSFGAWLLVSTAAVVGAFASWMFLGNVSELIEIYDFDRPTLAYLVPPVLTVVAILLLFGGIITWMSGRFPGLNKTQNAIDWAGNSEAVSRLLSVGCTYPEAFSTVANVAKTKESRTWLTQAAARIEQGGPEIGTTNASGGDTAIVELLLESSFANPSEKWQTASEHFDNVARQRSALLTATMPVLSILCAGLFIWISISATLGWMWSSASGMIGGLMQ